MNDRPVIGVIACNREVEGEPAQTVKLRYVAGVRDHAGAVPVLVPSLGHPEDAEAVVARLDAVLLTGSTSNVEPHRYRAETGHPPHDAPRDETALALVRAGIAANVPVIGICRGLQEINVALGGTLVDQRDAGLTEFAHHAPGDADLEGMFAHFHPAKIEAGSHLAEITGQRELWVNSVHFQTIARLGEGLKVEARAPDGVIEAVSSADGEGVFAVQWHPEWRPRERPHDIAFWRHVGDLARRARERRTG